ncbi:MAG: sensor histidine kinase [Pleomorphochaeta sp.]
MIKKMRRNFVLISMVFVLMVIFIMISSINVFMEKKALEEIDIYLNNSLHEVYRPGPFLGGVSEAKDPFIIKDSVNVHSNTIGAIESKGMQPDPIGATVFIRGFSVQVDKDLKLINVEFNDNELLECEILNYINQVINNGAKEKVIGEIDNYRYIYSQRDEGFHFVFVNTSVQNETLNQLMRLTIIIGIISFFVLTIFMIILSSYIVKPVRLAFEKQKRFISDSSHELKTPLSIISANMELLEKEVGQNKRIDEIKNSEKRMNLLVQDLLTLSRLENNNHVIFEKINLSKIIDSCVLSFEVLAFEHSNKIISSVEEDIFIQGVEKNLYKLIGIFIENAIKYSWSNTDIVVSLYKQSKNIVLEFYNKGIGVKKEEIDKIFDNFYRVDNSRGMKPGGYGIGLSIAKSIINQHKGKILIESEYNSFIKFKIIF